MVNDVEIFLALLVLLIGIICIFNARFFVRGKVKKEKENMVVNIVKVVGFLVLIASLTIIYNLR